MERSPVLCINNYSIGKPGNGQVNVETIPLLHIWHLLLHRAFKIPILKKKKKNIYISRRRFPWNEILLQTGVALQDVNIKAVLGAMLKAGPRA